MRALVTTALEVLGLLLLAAAGGLAAAGLVVEGRGLAVAGVVLVAESAAVELLHGRRDAADAAGIASEVVQGVRL